MYFLVHLKIMIMSYVVQKKVVYQNDRTNHKYELPALFTENGLVISHLRYLVTQSHKSPSWKTKSTFSLKLLLEYLHANASCFDAVVDLLHTFTVCLIKGTIDQELYDPTDLYWKPRDINDANTILAHITNYTDYLATQQGYEENRVNPYRKATSTEQRLNWCAYYQKTKNVFSNQFPDSAEIRNKMSRQRVVNGPKAPNINHEETKKFPEERFIDLLYKGFIRPYSNADTQKKSRLDYKNIAITMLLNYGGLRKSEVFHLYTSDITINPASGGALVRVFHPSLGKSPAGDYKNRRELLNNRYGLKPRNEYALSERLYAGWKSPLLTSTTNKSFDVIFSPSSAAHDFLEVYKEYIKHQRVDPDPGADHPFAFTNQHGAPETLKNYQRLHKRAVERIGLTCSKNLGTTEHGHRHSYGYRLAQFGLSQVEIQKAMHHKNPNSCLVYIQPTSADIRAKMQAIEEKQ